MRKHFPLVVVLFIVSLSTVAFGQLKTITPKEYDAAEDAARAATASAYPRIKIYTYRSSGMSDISSREVAESAKRFYRETKTTSASGTEKSEMVRYDGETFERVNGGVWEIPYGFGGGQGNGAGPMVEITCTLTDTEIDGKPIKVYMKVRNFANGKRWINYFKVDDAGRMLEFRENADGESNGSYEYSKTVKPIIKPKLGSKEDI